MGGYFLLAQQRFQRAHTVCDPAKGLADFLNDPSWTGGAMLSG